MARQRFRRRVACIGGRIRLEAYVMGALVILTFALSRAGMAQCTERPVVWMNEGTAASHLLSNLKFVFPAGVPALARIQSVVVVVTVNRKGHICKANAAAGPKEFRRSAETIVKKACRYRPFLLDSKPVVVQFPVRVNFVVSADKREVKIPEVAGKTHQGLDALPVSEAETQGT